MRLSSLGKALFGLASARRSRPIMKLVCGSRYAIPGSASHRRMQDESSIDLRRPIQAFSDRESVLESYRNASFDVIVLDMHMPGRTGLEVARAIRLLESKGQNRRTPIIMLTAAASTDLREDSLDAGVDLFLSKPVDPRALLRGVNQVFFGADRTSALIASDSQAQGEYVDRVLLQDMAKLSGDSRFIQTLTHNFSRDARQLVDQIEAAMIRKDRDQFRELTHALKGAARMPARFGCAIR